MKVKEKKNILLKNDSYFRETNVTFCPTVMNLFKSVNFGVNLKYGSVFGAAADSGSLKLAFFKGQKRNYRWFLKS